MIEDAQLRRKRGTVTVLALLLTVLLAPATGARAELDLRTARAAAGETVKSALVVRAGLRGQDEERADSDPRVLPPLPAASRATLQIHPGAAVKAGAATLALPAAPSPYRARAPPLA